MIITATRQETDNKQYYKSYKYLNLLTIHFSKHVYITLLSLYDPTTQLGQMPVLRELINTRKNKIKVVVFDEMLYITFLKYQDKNIFGDGIKHKFHCTSQSVYFIISMLHN